MRIAMLCDMYLPHVSGVTNHITLTKRALEDLGHDVWVVTFGDRDFEDTEPNVVRSPGVPWGDTGYRFAVSHSRQARELLGTMDVLHAHHPFQSGRLALAVRGDATIPVVMTNHSRYDLYADVYASFVPTALRRTFVRETLLARYTAADLVLAPAQTIADWIAREIGVKDNVEVLPNGVDTARFRAAREDALADESAGRVAVREQFGFTEDDVVAVFVGRLGTEKNLHLLLDAFEQARRETPALALLLIGGGPLRAELEQRVHDKGLFERIIFAGMQPYEAVPSLLAACDFFVTASVTEVHPLTIIESMAAGLPIVAVHAPGAIDSVTDNVDGLLAAENAEAIADALEVMAGDEERRHAMGEAAARTAVEHYDVNAAAAKLAQHYAALIEAAEERASQPKAHDESDSGEGPDKPRLTDAPYSAEADADDDS